jgi:diguanylate cyclase (GGDEF)-like protein
MAIEARDFEAALAVELFNRTKFSASVGTIGVGIMAYPHLTSRPWQTTLPWSAVMVSLLLARFLHARFSLEKLKQGADASRLIHPETLLCALIGIGWGSSVFVFDTQVMDQAFYLRLMIIAGAMAFIVASTAVLFRIFLAYTLPIGGLVILFILSHPYVQPAGALMLSIALFSLMLVGQAFNMNRSIRAGIANHLSVLHLTDELNAALGTERKLRDELKLASLTDELTGVFNRRGIAENLATEIARTQRLGSALSVLMIDIDNFKPINDTHGHPAGDLVLRTVVESLQKELRETDVLGRMGGDEFLVVLPALERDGAFSAAERLHRCVQSSAMELKARGISVTISVGVASYRKEDESEHLLSRADQALYLAKEKGRNRIETDLGV